MKEKIKVLHVTEKIQAGGIENFIMNVYRNIDREKVDFDFFVTREEEEFFEEEIKELGGKKFTINIDKKNNVLKRVLKESKELEKFLKQHNYDVVHIHSGTPLRVFYLRAAKRAGIKKRIYHSHSAEVKGPHSSLRIKKIIFGFLKKLIPLYSTNCLACSKLAAEWMYPEKTIREGKVIIINNGINFSRFLFNSKLRKQYRKEFNVEDNIVLGHVGRFNEQKNHVFLIDIFDKLYKRNNNYRLLLIGEGELKDNIRKKIDKLDLNEKVKFLGVRNDVNNIMQAMDIFLLPSNYEGLPVVGIESQVSGLPLLCSSNITKEVSITPNVVFLPIDDADLWVNAIENISLSKRDEGVSDYLKDSRYEIKDVCRDLEEIYEG